MKRLAQKNLDEIEVKIVELRNLREVIVHLLDHCAGDDRPECPIINDLSGDGSSGNLIRH